jgi:hypothetical protein
MSIHRPAARRAGHGLHMRANGWRGGWGRYGRASRRLWTLGAYRRPTGREGHAPSAIKGKAVVIPPGHSVAIGPLRTSIVHRNGRKVEALERATGAAAAHGTHCPSIQPFWPREFG